MSARIRAYSGNSSSSDGDYGGADADPWKARAELAAALGTSLDQVSGVLDELQPRL